MNNKEALVKAQGLFGASAHVEYMKSFTNKAGRGYPARYSVGTYAPIAFGLFFVEGWGASWDEAFTKAKEAKERRAKKAN
jgi:hypothetical protein